MAQLNATQRTTYPKSGIKTKAVHYLSPESAEVIRQIGYAGAVYLPCGRVNSDQTSTVTPTAHLYSYSRGRMLRKKERDAQAIERTTCKSCRKALKS